ncbi:hypothetical protein ACQI4L_09020 [Mycolicibacterium litorale]|uniref:SGNH/GDSL hydrolase family protein n=1 Tax=Mycolicibacterium litorale TaxID=758802 RepID=UPI003CE7AFE5
MTAITQNIADIAGASDNTAWVFYTPGIRESSSGGVVSPKKVRKYPADGVLTVELDPGPAVVIAPDNNHYPFIVPEEDTQLWPLIQAAVTIPPTTAQEKLASAVSAWLTSHGGAGPVVAEELAVAVPPAVSAELTEQTPAAVAAELAEQAPPVVSAVLADQAPPVVAAAVTADIAGRSLLESHDARLPQVLDPTPSRALVETDEVGRVSRYVDNTGRTWLKPHPDMKVRSENLADEIPVPKTVPTDEQVVFAVTDSADRAAISVHPDGTVTINLSTAARSSLGLRTQAEPTWSTKKRTWNPERALYNFHPTSLQKWYAALARAMAGSGTAHITTFVDLETYGAANSGASQPKWRNSWPGRVRRRLDALTGYASGTGIVPALNILFETPADDPRWVFGAGAAQLVPAGSSGSPNYGVLGRGAVRLTNTSGTGFFEFTPVGNVNRFTIFAIADPGATGVATVKVDGNSVGTFDVSAAGGSGTLNRRTGVPANVIVVDITGLASGAHTLRVEGPAASTLTVWAVEGATGAGVRVSNLARSGVGSTAFALDDTTNHFYGLPLHVDTVKADLAIMMLGLNDRSTASSTFVTRVESAIERVRAAGGDVLLVCPGQPNYASLPDPLPPRLTDLYGLADTYDLPLLDTAWVRTDFATANALGLYADTIHSNDTGLEHHARLIFNALTGA